jgi:hypothetical protein
MIDHLTFDERASHARKYVDNAERWLRKIIHHQLTLEYGSDYGQQEDLLNSSIRNHIDSRKAQNPNGFPRDIDATTFEQALSIVCNPKFFAPFFKKPLSSVYPLGASQARFHLERLITIRNDVSHGRGSTSRQLEQAICYTNDLVDALQVFFRETGLEKTYNVPTILRYSDNRGNVTHLEELPENIYQRIKDWRQGPHGELHPGEILIAEIEIDPSFEPDTYDVSWQVLFNESGLGSIARIEIGPQHVGEQFELRFTIRTKRAWHRFTQADEGLNSIYRVLPPLD